MTLRFLTDEDRWAAAHSRDRAADGAFICCVRTTGIYCRPSCAGRPLRKNVFYVATVEEARLAGMRACKRCRPDDLPARGHTAPPRDLVARLG